MTVTIEKFLKAKRFTTDHTLDDATDQVLVKTTAGSSVGDAIAAATGAQSLATAIAADAAAQTTLATALADNLGASAAETIAGTEAAKFVSPDDMKAALQSAANYQIVIDRPAGAYSRSIIGYMTTGAASNGDLAGSAPVVGSITSGVTTPASMASSAVVGSNGSAGAGAKAGVYAYSIGTGGTNYGVYGYALNGTTNWAGYFDGNTTTTNRAIFGVNGQSGIVNGTGAGSGAVIEGDNGSLLLQKNASSAMLYLSKGGGFTGPVAAFHVSGSLVGDITVTGTGTTYNSISDHRLKIVDGPVTNSGAFVDALKPVTGEWKVDPGKKANFFLAHEVQEVSPSSVQGTKDAVESVGTFTRVDGSTQENFAEPLELRDGESWVKTGEREVMQSMEYGSADFIVNMIAELQSLRKRVAALEGAVL